ncbi:MAG: CDP-alcohol phosphatidyltransferase family protein [Bacteroidota bacterium]
MRRKEGYAYRTSLKSSASDELINTYLLRPAAGVLVRLLYGTRVTPNQLTIGSIAAGLVAALLYAQASAQTTIVAGLLVTVKDILDGADGQLARSRQQYSRAGRFLDSIGDFLVNAAVFAAFSGALYTQTGNPALLALGFLAFLGTTLRVSYHVHYQTAFLHLQGGYSLNRMTEELREEDLHANRGTVVLQRIFQGLYGWQDRLVSRLDSWCRHAIPLTPKVRSLWYADPLGLRLSSFLGLGTELSLLTVTSLFVRLDLYLCLNLFLMNGIWAGCIAYRRWVLSRRVR